MNPFFRTPSSQHPQRPFLLRPGRDHRHIVRYLPRQGAGGASQLAQDPPVRFPSLDRTLTRGTA